MTKNLKKKKHKTCQLWKKHANSERKAILTGGNEDVDKAFLQWALTKRCQNLDIHRV